MRRPDWLIATGSLLFILMLALSALWDPTIRWLHFFQAWMYLATPLLALRRNRWGYFIGISAAGLWDYTNLFVTTFLVNGLQQASHWLHTGHLPRPDLLVSIPAWIANLLVVAGCLWGYWRLATKSAADAGRLVIAFVLTTGFFALDMAVCQPRYLPLFRSLLHPHLPY